MLPGKIGFAGQAARTTPMNVTVNVAAASNRCFQFRRDPPLTFNRWFCRELYSCSFRTSTPGVPAAEREV